MTIQKFWDEYRRARCKKQSAGDPNCEFCGGSGIIEHLPLHPDDTFVMDSPCECVGSDSDDDTTPE
jgi:hypothetical protein